MGAACQPANGAKDVAVSQEFDTNFRATQVERSVRPVAVASAQPLCVSGCGRPTWNGQAGKYCSLGCRSNHMQTRADPVVAPALVTACPLCVSGCGRPTWNGELGKYCSLECRSQHLRTRAEPAVVSRAPATSPPLCLNGCGSPTWNGEVGKYCSFQCRCIHKQLPRPPCKRPGCRGLSWNWEEGKFCTTECRNADAGTCIRPGCSKSVSTPEFCSTSCANYAKDSNICVRLGCGRALTARARNSSFCSLECQGGAIPAAQPQRPATPEQVCSRCGRPALGRHCTRCSSGHIWIQRTPKEEEHHARLGGSMLSGPVDSDLRELLSTHFAGRWDSEHFGPPEVKAIFHVDSHGMYQSHIHFAKQITDPSLQPYGTDAEMPGNMKLRFHGTLLACDFQGTPCSKPICSVCCIIKNGFATSRAGTGHGNRYYGDGIYCSSSSATAYKFSRNARAVLAVSVVCGKMLVRDRTNANEPTDGKEIVMLVKNPDDSMATAVMPGRRAGSTGVAVEELVVKKPEAIHAKYLFVLGHRGGPKCSNFPQCYNRSSRDSTPCPRCARQSGQLH